MHRERVGDRDGGNDEENEDEDMGKGKDPVTTTTKEGEKPTAATDKYPGIEGATRGEVDAFLEALDDFQPVVRV